MTRSQCLQMVAGFLDEIIDREVDRFDQCAHAAEIAQWKAEQLAEIEQRMDAARRSLLH